MMQRLKRSWFPALLYVALLAVFLLPSVSFAQQNPSLIGAGSDPCVLAGPNGCNNTDTVQALMVTQDVLVYLAAAFLFFFGFMVGIRLMLGAITRHES